MTHLTLISRRRHTFRKREHVKRPVRRRVHRRGLWLRALERHFGAEALAGCRFSPPHEWQFGPWCRARELDGWV